MQPRLSEQREDSGRTPQDSSIKRNGIYAQLSRKKDKQCHNIYSTGSLWKQARCTPKLQEPPHPRMSGLVPVSPIWREIGGEHLSQDTQLEHKHLR